LSRHTSPSWPSPLSLHDALPICSRLADPAVVEVSLHGDLVDRRRVPIEPEPSLFHVPVVGGVLATGQHARLASPALAVDPIVHRSEEPRLNSSHGSISYSVFSST